MMAIIFYGRALGLTSKARSISLFNQGFAPLGNLHIQLRQMMLAAAKTHHLELDWNKIKSLLKFSDLNMYCEIVLAALLSQDGFS